MAIFDLLELYLPSFEGMICWGSEERREKKEKSRAKFYSKTLCTIIYNNLI